ncbi:MAG: A/G-specific adenine glycosylase, partial [Clostridia bacterium]|nr:A/G-specific adenine glycosylase [Clostridia bacterium]
MNPKSEIYSQNPHPIYEISAPLVEWYRQNKRDLPWRNHPTPYMVWVSEIMLQQTRVEIVKPYFLRFIQALPTIRDLANAPEEQLLKLWEGLGYYSRVRNMQKAAKDICERFGGELPPDYNSLLSLCGIGSYTAGAIASFAFGLPYPAVDGNVLRVVARLTADDRNILDQATKKDMEHLLAQIIPHDCPGDFGQGLIELGALVCLPNRGEVKCEKCPLADLCLAHAQGLVDILPTRFKQQTRRTERLTVFLIETNQGILLRKRQNQGLLAGLWEFPHTEGHLSPEDADAFLKANGISPLSIIPLGPANHIFTHITWEMIGYRVNAVCHADTPLGQNIPFEDLAELAIPSAFSAYKKAIHAM